MGLLTKRSDEDAQLEAVAQRVHGVPRTCALCGALAACDTDAVEYRTGLNGEALLFGSRCRDCARLGPHWQRNVVAKLLGLPTDALLIETLTVPKFIDTPGARPDRPNTEPWGHVNVAGLHERAERRRADIDRATGGPCAVCGATLTPLGTQWRTDRRIGGDGEWCARCVSWQSGYRTEWKALDDMRVLASNVLLGHSTPTSRLLGPPGVPTDLGLVLWAESGLSKGTIAPFGWLDVTEMSARAVERGIGRNVDPARWLMIDRHMHRS